MPSWFSTNKKNDELTDANIFEHQDEDSDMSDSGKANVELAKESLTQLLGDSRVPDSVRDVLSDEYKQLGVMLKKIRAGASTYCRVWAC